MAEHRHWKEDSNTNYLGAEGLPDGKDIIVQIKDAGPELVRNPKTNKEEKKRVIYFEGDIKPLICNETNAKRIARLAGSGYYDAWVGMKIQLYAEPNSQSESGFAVRVREFAPR